MLSNTDSSSIACSVWNVRRTSCWVEISTFSTRTGRPESS